MAITDRVSANFIDQSTYTFMRLKVHAFKIRYLIGRNHDAIYKLQSSYKVHLNAISKSSMQ